MTPRPVKETLKKANKPGLRMNELMAATGQPRSTLTHWIKQGLLPEPVKTSRNMAYYHPECVARAALIKRMQDHYMPLDRIKKYFEILDQGMDIDPMLDLYEDVVGPRQERIAGLDEFCRLTGLSGEQVLELVDSRLIAPMEDGFFDSEDEALGRDLARLLSMGLSVADLQDYRLAASGLVEASVAHIIKIARDLPYDQASKVKKEYYRTHRRVFDYLAGRIFKLMLIRGHHTYTEKQFINKHDRETGPDQ